MVRCILSDIEGTTTPIHFVHDVLFPFSAKHLRSFVAAAAGDRIVQGCLEQVRTTAEEEGTQLAAGDDAAVELLLAWITADRKHPALKKLQGMIWKDGYTAGAFQAPIYPDVPPALKAWQAKGLQLAIYSSGSVEAQQLLFRYSDHGDLRPYFTAWFDTAVGAKRQAASYERIAAALALPPQDILFLSDIVEELDAAQSCGLGTIQIVRAGTAASTKHPTAASFADV